MFNLSPRCTRKRTTRSTIINLEKKMTRTLLTKSEPKSIKVLESRTAPKSIQIYSAEEPLRRMLPCSAVSDFFIYFAIKYFQSITFSALWPYICTVRARDEDSP